MHTCLLPNLELGSRITTTDFKYGIGFGFENIPEYFYSSLAHFWFKEQDFTTTNIRDRIPHY